MRNITPPVFFLTLVFVLAGCGTLEVGIETTPKPAPSDQSAATATGTRTPVITLTLSSTPTPTKSTPSATTTPAPERITFPVGGTTFAFTTKLTASVEQRYILQILAQQKMSITTGSNVTITVVDDGNNPLQPSASSPGQWHGTIPQKGDYIIELLGQGLVTVTIDIPPPGS